MSVRRTRQPAGDAGADGAAGQSGALPYILLRETQAANTDAGSSAGTTWNIRNLNVEEEDADGLCTTSFPDFVLAAGDYRASISAMAWLSNKHKIRLRNTTGGTTLLVGTTETSGAGDAAGCRSVAHGVFTVAAAQSLQVEHWTDAGAATWGLGRSGSDDGEIEVYCIAEFWKLP